MDDLLHHFVIEGREQVEQASADFAALARDPQDASAVDSAFRAIHTLKGSVAIFALTPAERVLHAAEDVLEQARKGAGALNGPALAGLVACLDAVDRWIDEMERDGSLSSGADAAADAALALLPGRGPGPPAPDPGESAWLPGLLAREEQALAEVAGPVVAFRYTPDAECFFRGEDPLETAQAVPELAALDIQPADGAWPPLGRLEPFVCITVLEGLSTAPLESIRAAFRLVPDQVELHVVEPSTAGELPSLAPAIERLSGAPATTLRIDAARLDALTNGLGELAVAINGIGALTRQADAVDPPLAAGIRALQAEMERVAGTLRRTVGAVRLVPLAPTLRRLPRMAREIGQGLGKAVVFEMSGEDTEADKQIAESLFEPLLHLLRNAIDHGIEDAAARRARGKPDAGRVSLTVSRSGDAVMIAVSDDGGGIDPAQVRTAAVSRGVIDGAAADQMSDAAALRLILAPGFSTAGTVTEVSGRGVGMDAVQAAVERLRGTIDIASEPGAGSRFTLRLPASALTTRLLVVSAGGERYGIPLDQIAETVRLGNDAIKPVGSGEACVLRGRTVPVLSLAALLGSEDRLMPNAKLLVTGSGGERIAIKVDAFEQRLDALVRPPGKMLDRLPGVSGSTLLADGGVLLVLDLPALAA